MGFLNAASANWNCNHRSSYCWRIIFFQRITINQINDLQAAKQRLVGLHVDADLRDGASLSLTGESLTQFQRLQADYKEVNDHRFKEIDELADDIRHDVRSVNFIKVRQEVSQLKERVAATEKKLLIIQGTL